MTVAAQVEAADYCAQQVRRYDHDRWLTALFAPTDRRATLLALYAFNLEIARTAEQVSEPMLGEIRLQWWRESLEGIYAGAPRRHPVVLALAQAVAATQFDRALFEQMIDARVRDLYQAPPADLVELEAYAEATSGNLVRLALQGLGVHDRASAEIGSDIGTAYALVGLIRATPHLARQQRVIVPAAVLAEQGIDADALLRDQARPQTNAALRRLAEAAAARLAAARARRPRAPKSALPALLPAALADLYLKRLKRSGIDPWDARADVATPRRQLRLLAKAVLGRY